MKLSEDLAWRGLIKDKTFKDNKWLDKPQTFYHGVDVSADSLTIGNLAVLMLARRLIDAGWRAVLLVGGATTLIGDPGGKTQERELLSRKEIKNNTAAIKKQVSRLFADQDFRLEDNYRWLSETKYLDFLREHGKRFSMTELMQREFVTERMGERAKGISYAEFSYGLVQGYDYYVLNEKNIFDGKKLGVALQIGGSDQWSNMLMGVSMIRKKTGKEAHALSMPLIVNKATGTKFGKSEAGAVWLDPNKTSPTKFYQFWMNVDDTDSGEYLKKFTLLPKAEIEEAVAQQKKNPAERTAQRRLAKEITELVHGREQTHTAEVVSDVLTGKTLVGDVSDGIVKNLRDELPYEKFKNPPSVAEALTVSGLTSSKSEARRLLASNAVYVDGKNQTEESLSAEQFKNGRLLLRRGKALKDSALIEITK